MRVNRRYSGRTSSSRKNISLNVARHEEEQLVRRAPSGNPSPLDTGRFRNSYTERIPGGPNAHVIIQRGVDPLTVLEAYSPNFPGAQSQDLPGAQTLRTGKLVRCEKVSYSLAICHGTKASIIYEKKVCKIFQSAVVETTSDASFHRRLATRVRIRGRSSCAVEEIGNKA